MSNYNRKYNYSSYSHKKKSVGSKIGSVVISLLAVVILFVAGALIGNLPQVKSLFNKTPTTSGSESTPPSTTSSGEVSVSSDVPNDGKLGDDVNLVDPDVKNTLSQITAMNIDDVQCESYIVIDRLTGEVLLEKNSDGRIYPASTTKIMTTALTLEKTTDLSQKVTATNGALSLLTYDASKIGLVSGEEMSIEGLLYGTMLQSGCDSANVLAATVGEQNYNKFVAEMVTKSKSIGCTGTYFVNPNGIHSSSHFSTASDLARMESYAQLNPTYRKIVSTKEYNIESTNIHTNDGWNIIRNSNPLLGREDIFPADSNILKITGSKTGTTTQSGYSIVCSAVTKDGTQLVAVMCGIPYNKGNGFYDRLPEMYTILENGAKNAKTATKNTILDENISDELLGSVKNILPIGAKVYAEYGISATTGENVLENGEVPIFTSDTNYQITANYYNNIEELLLTLDKNEVKEIGYLEVKNADGVNIIDNIPLYVKE